MNKTVYTELSEVIKPEEFNKFSEEIEIAYSMIEIFDKDCSELSPTMSKALKYVAVTRKTEIMVGYERTNEPEQNIYLQGYRSRYRLGYQLGFCMGAVGIISQNFQPTYKIEIKRKRSTGLFIRTRLRYFISL